MVSKGLPRHLLSLMDYNAKEIEEIIRNAKLFKEKRRERAAENVLKGKSIALIFEKPSTRTRASMGVAVYELGGQPFFYNKTELQLRRGEPIKDTVRVLSRYHDAIAARVLKHETLIEMAKYSSVPVINMLSNLYHPLQALADYLTILEHKGKIKGVTIAFIGDGKDNVFNSLAIAGVKLGAKIIVASPPSYQPVPGFIEDLKNAGSGTITVVDDPRKAVKNAEVIYTDVFVSMGQEEEREERLKAFLPEYQVNRQLLSYTTKDYIFMHCLPAFRGQEVTDEVIEDVEHSVVFEQAENRLHTAKAVLAYLLGGE